MLTVVLIHDKLPNTCPTAYIYRDMLYVLHCNLVLSARLFKAFTFTLCLWPMQSFQMYLPPEGNFICCSYCVFLHTTLRPEDPSDEGQRDPITHPHLLVHSPVIPNPGRGDPQSLGLLSHHTQGWGHDISVWPIGIDPAVGKDTLYVRHLLELAYTRTVSTVPVLFYLYQPVLAIICWLDPNVLWL